MRTVFVIVGYADVREVQVPRGTTARDIKRALGLPDDYQISVKGNMLADTEDINWFFERCLKLSSPPPVHVD